MTDQTSTKRWPHAPIHRPVLTVLIVTGATYIRNTLWGRGLDILEGTCHPAKDMNGSWKHGPFNKSLSLHRSRYGSSETWTFLKHLHVEAPALNERCKAGQVGMFGNEANV